MTPQEAGKILGLAAARDRRTVGEADILAWMEDLDGITFDEARQAVARHFQTTTGVWLTAGHVRAIVKLIRAEQKRHQRSDLLALPGRTEPDPERGQRINRGIAVCADVIAKAKAKLANEAS